MAKSKVNTTKSVEVVEDATVENKEFATETTIKKEVISAPVVDDVMRIIPLKPDITIYNQPTLLATNKIGALKPHTAYTVLGEVNTTMFGTFYRLKEGFVMKTESYNII